MDLNELQKAYDECMKGTDIPDYICLPLGTLRQFVRDSPRKKIRRELIDFIEQTKGMLDNRLVYIWERTLILEK